MATINGTKGLRLDSFQAFVSAAHLHGFYFQKEGKRNEKERKKMKNKVGRTGSHTQNPMSDARNVVELLPHVEEATVAAVAVAVPRAPKAPDVGDPVEKWEGWIARCVAYMKEKRIAHRSVDASFADYREREIKRYGTWWATVVREGNDVHHLKSMEVEWKWLSYLALKGRLPSFSRYTCRRSYRR